MFDEVEYTPGTSSTQLLDLNDDALLHIFTFVRNADLPTLDWVCLRFKRLLHDIVLTRRCRQLLMTSSNFASASAGTPTIHQRRTLNVFTPLDRVRIEQNWKCGRYVERTLFNHRLMYPSALHLERDSLFMSHRGEIRRHRRLRTSHADDCMLDSQPSEIIGDDANPDVTCFRRSDDTGILFGGRNNGTWFVHEAGEDLLEGPVLDDGPARPVAAVDLCADLFVTAAGDRLSLWRQGMYMDDPVLDECFAFEGVEYKSLRIAGDRMACGKYRDETRGALQLLQLDRPDAGIHTLNSRTVAVYALRWLDANIILTGNYDSTCRLHDLRCNADVLSWMDAYDAAVYTLDHDGQHAVLAGTSANCRVALYDLRRPDGFVQLFYPRLEAKLLGSPVYGLACDASQLFVATDHNLRVFDFRAFWAADRDYRDLFAQVIICAR